MINGFSWPAKIMASSFYNLRNGAIQSEEIIFISRE